jgi:murein DD-endopeptidase MepM/ murein hydrolase activator NlpD
MADLAWPLMINRIRDGEKSNAYGKVRTNKDGTPRVHQGWDLQTPRGMHCYAVANGAILETQTKPNDKGYGEYVLLQFDNPVGEARYAFYGHLSQIFVQKGDRVRVGDPIGLVGVTGNAVRLAKGDDLSTLALPKPEDHLHFELRSLPKPSGLHGCLDPQKIYGQVPLTSAVIALRSAG